MNDIHSVLMRRDNLSSSEATERIKEAKELLQHYLETNQMELAESICEDEFGLEPDYIFDLI